MEDEYVAMTLRDLLSDESKLRLRSVLGRIGIEIGSYTGSFAEHRGRLIESCSVATVWDVGAHIGQYGHRVRREGYTGTLVSIEPSRKAFHKLSARARRDGRWITMQVAVADTTGRGTLNVSANGQSSSLFEMRERHIQASAPSRYIARESVAITTLDAIEAELKTIPPYYVKLDLQGAEGLALRGGHSVIGRSVACEVELSLVTLYDGGESWRELVGRLEAQGLAMCDVERVFFDHISRDLLQINAMFRRVDVAGTAD
jgi:FkbM family methyltransferase